MSMKMEYFSVSQSVKVWVCEARTVSDSRGSTLVFTVL